MKQNTTLYDKSAWSNDAWLDLCCMATASDRVLDTKPDCEPDQLSCGPIFFMSDVKVTHPRGIMPSELKVWVDAQDNVEWLEYIPFSGVLFDNCQIE